MTREQNPPPVPEFSPTIGLLTLARTLEVDLAAELAPLGLNLRKFGMLGHIGASSGISFSELARRSRVTVQSAHAAVGELSRAGYVRDGSARAGAAADLTLTDAGVQVLDQAKAMLRVLDAERFGAAAGTEQERLATAVFDAMMASFAVRADAAATRRDGG